MMKLRYGLPAVILLSGGIAILPLAQQEGPGGEAASLAHEVGMLEARIGQLEAENEIENLQRIYGFYIDKQLWTQAADLFTEDATYEAGGSGVYRGRERILEYFHSQGPEGPNEGILNEHMQLQPVIHVSADGTAQGRWHHFSQEAVYGESHFWGTGVYENEYRLEDGAWKISRIHRYSNMRTPFEEGWHETALPRSMPSEELPPDAPPSVDYEHYPAVHVVPFHYENPVTGDNSVELEPAPLTASLDAIEARLDSLEHRGERLADADAVERLHVIYGYYLARNQWDDLAGIFTEDGSIEIALRGVYRGRDSVRRNLDLYGGQDELHGELHNHMQYQPVIHVSDDGNTAWMRSRAFSMMGSYGGSARWMGGTYENVFEKRDGIWKLHMDQVFNTYFADYDVGWKDYVWRPAPGISEDNPPDEPPTTYFEMYPRVFLPPFHYDNPVTGRQTDPSDYNRPFPDTE